MEKNKEVTSHIHTAGLGPEPLFPNPHYSFLGLSWDNGDQKLRIFINEVFVQEYLCWQSHCQNSPLAIADTESSAPGY